MRQTKPWAMAVSEDFKEVGDVGAADEVAGEAEFVGALSARFVDRTC